MAGMPDKGFKSITVTEEVHKRLFSKSEKEKVSISYLASHILASSMEAEEKLGRYAPLIELLGFEDNYVLLKDRKLNRVADVYMHDKELFCALDESKNCIHISFCQALPQVRRVFRG